MASPSPKAVAILGSTAHRIRELMGLLPENRIAFLQDGALQDRVTLRWILAVTGCLRLAVELVKSQDLAQTSGLGDFFECLADAGILPEEQVGDLQEMTALRNQLLFDFDSVPVHDVYDIAMSSSAVMVEFLGCVAALCDAEEDDAEAKREG